MRESQQLFLRLRLVSEENQQSAIQTKIEHHFVRFFQQIKGRQPIGRKDSKQTVIPTSRRLDSFLCEAAQIFELFSNSRSKLKNQKHIAVNVLFKTYPYLMIPLSGWSNLAGRYLKRFRISRIFCSPGFAYWRKMVQCTYSIGRKIGKWRGTVFPSIAYSSRNRPLMQRAETET